MKAVLEITNGEFAGRKIALRSPVRMTIGRTVQSDYAIPYDSQLSSVHFEIEVETGGACVRDRGSTNGTFLNEDRIAYSELQHGERIQAGRTQFTFEIDEPPAPQTKPDSTMDTIASTAWDPEKPVNPLSSDRPPPAVVPPPFIANEHRVHEKRAIYSEPVDEEFTAEPRGVISSGRPFQEAFGDDSPAVIKAALEAAVWTRQPWLLDYCREQCGEQKPEQMLFYEMLGTLGEPTDLKTVHALALNPRLGWRRMSVVGKYGHPALLAFLIDNLANADERTAVAAGQAFQKIVGGDFESEERVTLPPEDGSEPDEFEAEFLDEEKLPDVKKAMAYLRKHGEDLGKSHRWSRGTDVSQPLTKEVFMGLDLESRWEAALRGVYREEMRLGPAQLLALRPLSSMRG